MLLDGFFFRVWLVAMRYVEARSAGQLLQHLA